MTFQQKLREADSKANALLVEIRPLLNEIEEEVAAEIAEHVAVRLGQEERKAAEFKASRNGGIAGNGAK